MNNILEEIQLKMEKVMEVVADDMATIRVGGAKAAMVQDIEIEAYGQRMKLVELANITAPDPTQILISAWDKSVVRNIEKGIMDSPLGLMPNVNGELIRIIVPPLTEERRRDYVKLLKQKLESGRVMLRQVRQDGREEVEKVKDDDGVSEDDVSRMQEELDKMTTEYSDKLERMAEEKEEEILRV